MKRHIGSLLLAGSSFVTSALLTGCVDHHASGDNPAGTFVIQSPATEILGMQIFLASPSEDLREEVSNYEFVSGLVARSECYFDLEGISLGKSEVGTESRRVVISSGDTVRSVLDKAGMRYWNGGQPQMRLITQNSIMQSPLGDVGKLQTSIQAFLARPVKSGDIIIAARVR